MTRTFMSRSHPEDNNMVTLKHGDVLVENDQVAGVYLLAGQENRLVLVMFDSPSAIHLSDVDFIKAYGEHRGEGGILTTLGGSKFKFYDGRFEPYQKRHFDEDDTEPIPIQRLLPGFEVES